MNQDISFKNYNQNQAMLLPPSLDELIAKDHLSRIVNSIIEGMDSEIFLEGYKGGGTSSYHPKMLAKIIVYAYITKTFSGRQMARLIRENIVYMWLAGQNDPDFRTINRFRSLRFKEGLKGVFKEVLKYCEKLELIKYEDYFIDGTKIEANSNKYRIVWSKNTKRFKERSEEKIDELLDCVDELIERENEEADEFDKEEQSRKKQLGSKEAKVAMEELISRLNKLSLDKKRHANKVVTKLKKEIKKQEKYEEQERKLSGRNSFCKTDPGAIGLRMKDNQLKPGYNILAGTENQIVLNYDVHDKAGDANCFIDHMDQFLKTHGKLSKNIVGDSAFGSEQNYEYLEKKGANNYLKYSMFYRETRSSFKNDRKQKENFKYDKLRDEFTCDENRRLGFKKEKISTTPNGYKQVLRMYESDDCSGCSNRCSDAERRSIAVNRKLDQHKDIARRNLYSEKGIELRKRRGIEIESIFGDLKGNFGFRRFNLRGKEKVGIELGLLFLAHNIKKLFQKMLSPLNPCFA